MINIKQIYEQFKEFISNYDADKLKLIKEKYRYNGYIADFQDTLRWFETIDELSDEDKLIVFGEKILTIDEIRQRMIDYYKSFEEDMIPNQDELEGMDEDEIEDYLSEEYGGLYDSAGYATKNLYDQIVSTINHFDEYMLLSFYTGNETDDYEVDFAGGRKYFTRGCKVDLYAFNYLYYTKKESDKYFIENNDVYYPKINKIPSNVDEIYEAAFDEKYKDLLDRYNSMLGNVINQFKNETLFNELTSQLKTFIVNEAWVKSKLREVKINEILN